MGHGPQGGDVFTVGVSPSNASLFYAGTRDGVFRTTDGGQSWSPLAFPGVEAGVFADPHEASRLFVSSGDDLYRSSDGGATFARVASASTQLAVDPTNTQVILEARVNSGLLRSGDGGATWTAVGPPDVVFQAVAIRGQLALAGVWFGGVSGLYRSTDGGTTWTPVNLVGPIPAVAIAENGSVAYAAGDYHVYRSTDGGGSWSVLANGLPTSQGIFFSVIDIAPANPQDVLVSTIGGGLYRTVDGGGSWTHLPNSPDNIDSSARAPGDAATVLVGTPDGVSLSRDNGATFVDRSSSLDVQQIVDVTFDAGNTTLFAARDTITASTSGLFRSADGGTTWTPTPLDPGAYEQVSMSRVVVDPANPNVLYAAHGSVLNILIVFGHQKAIYKSTDGGTTWTALSLRGTDVSALAIDPVSHALYAGARLGQISEPVSTRAFLFLSTDGGTTWTERTNGLPASTGVTDVAVAPNGVAYAALGFGGVYRTSDGGQHWTATGTELAHNAVLQLTAATGVVYAATLTGLFQSVDEGTSWTKVAGLPQGAVTTVLIDPSDARTLYAGTDSAVYRSRDGGGSWTALGPADLPRVTRLALDPASHMLYAATNGGSVVQLPLLVHVAVTKAGTGSGSVTSAPAGIDCGSTCDAAFDLGTTVTLTATPTGASSFRGWSGACTGSATCTVTADQARSVTATFDAHCIVPNVRGKTLAAARAALTSAKCATGSVHTARSKTVAKGHVISQTPQAGTSLTAGSRVDLVVSRGKK